MSKQISYIPLNTISRIQIYINKNKKSLAQIKKETGADYLINGGLYEPNWTPCCHLKADGVVYSKDQYKYFGFGWNTGSDIIMTSDYSNLQNYICCVALIDPTGMVKKPTYTSAQGGNRGRTAIGIKYDSLALYVSSDGSSDANTPQGLADELNDMCWSRAIMLDCGGSSQCDMNGSIIASSRAVQNLILVYTKKEEQKPVDKKYTVCLDAGHDAKDLGNCSPDKTYYEYKFAWDMANRVKNLLEKQGVNIVLSKNTQDEEKSLTNRAKVSNDAKADLFISFHSNAAGNSGWSDARGLEVYTSTDGATAKRNIAANYVINQTKQTGMVVRSNPLKHEPFTVLTATNAPAMLIEYGFHTNKDDVVFLNDSENRDKLAIATAKGTCDFLGVKYKEDAPVIPSADPNRAIVKNRFGFSDDTMNFLETYKWNTDLLRKLAEVK